VFNYYYACSAKTGGSDWVADINQAHHYTNEQIAWDVANHFNGTVLRHDCGYVVTSGGAQ
jgi:hypothetical protein